MMISAADRAEAQRLFARLQEAGAKPVTVDSLLPAETLLDLYGENIRHRAYVTTDPLRGEQMLRPDFTVPVVQMHMDNGAEAARYTYMGKVFRKQNPGSALPNEYLQVGYEVFDPASPAASDAEVFALFADMLADQPLRPVTGDLGILRAAVEGLTTSPRRKAALMRHIWRPRRFRTLLDRFAGKAPPPAGRTALVEAAKATPAADLIAAAGPLNGLRAPAEIEARVVALAEDIATEPIPNAEYEVMIDILGLSEPAPVALERLQDMAVDLPSLSPAIEGLEARLTALADRGIDVDALPFDASYGRASLEYYDGFVFGFLAISRADMPPVASGGRYDALTRVMGGGRSIPAVGGVVRPGLLTLLKGVAP